MLRITTAISLRKAHSQGTGNKETVQGGGQRESREMSECGTIYSQSPIRGPSVPRSPGPRAPMPAGARQPGNELVGWKAAGAGGECGKQSRDGPSSSPAISVVMQPHKPRFTRSSDFSKNVRNQMIIEIPLCWFTI